jgi:hypothetical protein
MRISTIRSTPRTVPTRPASICIFAELLIDCEEDRTLRVSCFGDSGGPVFLGDYVLGDASYVNSFSCNATGSYQRVDTTYSRAFLDQFLNT